MPPNLSRLRSKTVAKKGEGFGKAAGSIERKEGISKGHADAILASSARKASPAAKKANPNLKKVAKKK